MARPFRRTARCCPDRVQRGGVVAQHRVLDADGFADVVAISSQRKEVRDYVADQATLRLARTSNFVSAARPIVADAVSQAIATPAGGGGRPRLRGACARPDLPLHRGAAGERLLRAGGDHRAHRAREHQPELWRRRCRPNVLSATTTISQSPSVDTLVSASRWVEDLYIPMFLIGVALLALVIWKSRDRVHAIRASGILLAVVGRAALRHRRGDAGVRRRGRDQRPRSR